MVIARWNSPRSDSTRPDDPCPLLYDPKSIGSCVTLRPTAPRAYWRAILQQAWKIRDLTLLGFENDAKAEQLRQVMAHHSAARLTALRVVSLDLWAAIHLQSPTALAVGPTLTALIGPHLRVLQLKRVSLGRTSADRHTLVNALRHHAALQVVTIDAHSTQLTLSSATNVPTARHVNMNMNVHDNELSNHTITLDPLWDALATCPRLAVVQIYLSGHRRGQTTPHCMASLVHLVKDQLRELSLHMVSLPLYLPQLQQALSASRTLQVWHGTYLDDVTHHRHGTAPWPTILRQNVSLRQVSLDIPTPGQRAACWQSLAHHPAVTKVRLTPSLALEYRVPAFRKPERRYKPSSRWHQSTTTTTTHDSNRCNDNNDSDDADEGGAMVHALSQNARLVDIGEEDSASCPRTRLARQALVRLNRGPRAVHLPHWWAFVADYAHDLNALWALLRLHPQCLCISSSQ